MTISLRIGGLQWWSTIVSVCSSLEDCLQLAFGEMETCCSTNLLRGRRWVPRRFQLMNCVWKQRQLHQLSVIYITFQYLFLYLCSRKFVLGTLKNWHPQRVYAHVGQFLLTRVTGPWQGSVAQHTALGELWQYWSEDWLRNYLRFQSWNWVPWCFFTYSMEPWYSLLFTRDWACTLLATYIEFLLFW